MPSRCTPWTSGFAWFFALALAPGIAAACTGIRIKPRDGSVIYARTMEFAADLRSNILVVPRKHEFVGSGPGGKPGLAWTTKYGYAGMNAFGLPLVVDGVNEKGLAVGIFYFPGYAQYQPVGEAEVARSLAPHELAGLLLGTCSDVGEAVESAGRAVVGAIPLAEAGMVMPVHFVAHDASGRSAVLEYVGGKLVVHDNPLGVVTNAPTFDWHVTNLRNYINLMTTNAPPIELSGQRIAPLGQGSGMLGIPGDFTPPSRFVRAVAFTQSSVPSEDARAGVLQAFHILNLFDIPVGSVRESVGGADSVESTRWTTAADLTNRRYHFHTHGNRRIRMVDLNRLDLDSGKIVSIPIAGEEQVEDLAGPTK